MVLHLPSSLHIVCIVAYALVVRSLLHCWHRLWILGKQIKNDQKERASILFLVLGSPSRRGIKFDIYPRKFHGYPKTIEPITVSASPKRWWGRCKTFFFVSCNQPVQWYGKPCNHFWKFSWPICKKEQGLCLQLKPIPYLQHCTKNYTL